MRSAAIAAALAASLWGTPSSADPPVCGGQDFTVTVLPNGGYLWGGELVGEDDLQDRFVKLAIRVPAPNIEMLVDRKTLYVHVAHLAMAQALANYPCQFHIEVFR